VAGLLYRIVQSINANYGLIVAWGYIAIFLMALSLLFIFPQLTLLLFFLALASLSLTITLGWVIDAMARGLARRGLAAGRCPRCATALEKPLQPGEGYLCPECHSEFRVGGAERSSAERARYVESATPANEDFAASGPLEPPPRGPING